MNDSAGFLYKIRHEQNGRWLAGVVPIEDRYAAVINGIRRPERFDSVATAVAAVPELHEVAGDCEIMSSTLQAWEIVQYLEDVGGSGSTSINGIQWRACSISDRSDVAWIPDSESDADFVIELSMRKPPGLDRDRSRMLSCTLYRSGDLFFAWEPMGDDTATFLASDEIEAVCRWWPFAPNMVSTGLPIEELVSHGVRLRGSCWVNGSLWKHSAPRIRRGIARLHRRLEPAMIRTAWPRTLRTDWPRAEGRVQSATNEPLGRDRCHAVVLPQSGAAELALLVEAADVDDYDSTDGAELTFADGTALYGIATKDEVLALDLADYFGAFVIRIAENGIWTEAEDGEKVAWICAWGELAEEPASLAAVSDARCPCPHCENLFNI